LYGDNDQTFSSATWKGMYAHFTAAGGHAQLVDYGDFQKDARQAYTRYLAATRPRAFAIARDGAWGQASGIDSINAALVQCANGHEECRVYSVDGDVVWAKK
jgi:hypothetical protein